MTIDHLINSAPVPAGILLSVLPILYFFAKPIVGMLADYFSVSFETKTSLTIFNKNFFFVQKARKLIFMSVIAVMTISFGCYIFLPQQSSKLNFNLTEVQSCDYLVNIVKVCLF